MRRAILTIGAALGVSIAGSGLASTPTPNAFGFGPPPPVSGEILITPPFTNTTGSVTCAPVQRNPDMAWNGENHLSVWAEDAPFSTIFAARSSVTGIQLNGRGFVVGPSPSAHQTFPAVATDGENFLVVWNERVPGPEERYRLKARRVINDSFEQFEPILTLAVDLEPDSRPAVAFGGGVYLVVWESLRLNDDYLAASIVMPNGTVIGTAGFQINASFGRNPSQPDIVWTGTHFMVVWGEGNRLDNCGTAICPYGPMTDIFGRRVAPSGFMIDPTPIEISTSDELQTAPTVAWDGVSHMVTWSKMADDEPFGIVGRRLSIEGSVLFPNEPEILLVPQSGDELITGEVASDGTGFLVAWKLTLPDESIWGSRAAPQGAPIDRERVSGGFPIAREREDETDVSVLVRPDGRALVAYTREVAGDPCRGSRVAFRILGDPVQEPEPEPLPRRRRPATRP